jgi:hypothetical protein
MSTVAVFLDIETALDTTWHTSLLYIRYLNRNFRPVSFRSYQALGFTLPLTEMSTRNIKIIMFLGSKVRPVRRADNLNTIYEPIV